MDDAKWFRRLERCRCGKPAHGTLYNSVNAPIGAFCIRCADRGIKAAEEKRIGRPIYACCGMSKDVGHRVSCQHFDGRVAT